MRHISPRALTASVLSLGALLLVVSPAVVPAAHADGPDSGAPWVVSVGDSYISGEAGRWAGNSDSSESLVDAGGPATYFDNSTHTAETIPRCHRSTSADIYIGGGVNGLDLACSGAETTTVPSNSDGYFKPGIDFYNGTAGQGQALQLQNFAASHNVKMVAVSIGGNDFDFAGIIEDCVEDFLLSSSLFPNYCSDDSVTTSAMSASNVATVTANIATAFTNIRTAMRNAGYADDAWTLVVQNYPSPIPNSSGFRYSQSGFTRQSTGGCGFWNNDADYANDTLLPTINTAVANAATASGLTNIKTLNVQSAFNGRRLCENGVNLVEDAGIANWQSSGASDKTEWVNQIRTVSTATSDYYIQESLHPNYWGQLALRNCMRQVYDGGAPKSGTCTPGTGLDSQGEPNMTLN